MRIALLAASVLLLTACPKKEEAPPAPAPEPAKPAQAFPPPAPRIAQAECEFMAEWVPSEVKAAKVLFVVQSEPCLPAPEKPTRHGEKALDKPGKFFVEYYVPQGLMGHVCLYGYDERGALVGAAAWEKNPQKMEGQDDLIFPDIKLSLASVK